MGPRLGIFHVGFDVYPRSNDKDIAPGFYPSQPVLNLNEWQNIIDYYGATSPDSLPGQNRKKKISMGLTLFKAEIPSIPIKNAATSYVKVNADDTEHLIVVGDALKQNVYFFNRHFQITDSVADTGPVVDIDYSKNYLLGCSIGILTPNNGKSGKIRLINRTPGNHYEMDTTSFIDSLQRPVQVTPVDLNNDGKMDYIICEFGFLTGALSWMENTGSNNFVKHIIRNVPGAIKVYIRDYNNDGLPDIWALFAQGDESIFLFTNKGQRKF